MPRHFSRSDYPLGKCDRCGVTYKHSELSADINKPSLLVCHNCKDQLDPFLALLPYQRNLDNDLAIQNPRPLEKVEAASYTPEIIGTRVGS
jgi:NAD-dependent SIR2 family protein deacetylase